MNNLEDLESTLKLFLKATEALDFRFHLTGGLVASYYGEPRFTQDIDLVIELKKNQTAAADFIRALQVPFSVDEILATRAIETNDLFQALDTDRFIKIDFHVGEGIPGELQRSVPIEVFPGINVPMVSKEDSILSKLLWIKQGSFRSRKDVVMMLRGPHPINWNELENRAKELKVDELLKEVQNEELKNDRHIT